MNTTKNGIEVKVGQVWRDLDKRMFNRERVVVEVKDGKARMQSKYGAFPTWVSIRRMHRHSTGWALVNDCNLNPGHQGTPHLVRRTLDGVVLRPNSESTKGE